jgi:hypothetical protein
MATVFMMLVPGQDPQVIEVADVGLNVISLLKLEPEFETITPEIFNKFILIGNVNIVVVSKTAATRLRMYLNWLLWWHDH